MNIINSGASGYISAHNQLPGDFVPVIENCSERNDWCGSDNIFLLFWKCVIRGPRSSPSGFSSALSREFWISCAGNGFLSRYSSSCVETCCGNSAIDQGLEWPRRNKKSKTDALGKDKDSQDVTHS